MSLLNFRAVFIVISLVTYGFPSLSPPGQKPNETKSKFRETFDSINKNLSYFFPKIFGGGSFNPPYLSS